MSFDVIVYAALAVAIVLGFQAGLLRSAVTILGYLLAMPIAIWMTSLLSSWIETGIGSPWMQSSIVFCGAFVSTGIVLSTVLKMAIDELTGSHIGPLDRLGGSMLGAIRVGLVAVTMVLIFDQLVPANAEPAFLQGSQLRPILSAAGQKGFRSLPPDVADYIDRLKRIQR